MDSPVLFQSVDGLVECSANGTSKYNRIELETVFHFINELLKPSNVFGKTVAAKDIGVVTPYSAQLDKIQQICAQSVSYKKIMVGTGPIFQGKEKLVITVSMVVDGKCTKFAADKRVSKTVNV